LGVTVALLREMLRCGILQGEKRSDGWRISAPSLESLRQSLAVLRGQPELERNCWSWLYEGSEGIQHPEDWPGGKGV
jgi:hypothetical protein